MRLTSPWSITTEEDIYGLSQTCTHSSWRSPRPRLLEPLGISQYRLAKDISVPARRINEIVHCTRAVSANTARLARYFGTSDRFWLNLQARYDLEVERDHLGTKLENQVRVLDRAS